MAKERVLVVGLGEIGRTLFELLKENAAFTVYGLDLDKFLKFGIMIISPFLGLLMLDTLPKFRSIVSCQSAAS